MGKTLEVARDRAFDQTKTVLPNEVARGVYIEHPPSAQALKLMHLLISQAGGRMADEVQHEIRLSDIRKVAGMRNHDRASLRDLFIQLRAATMVYEDTETHAEIIGGFMDEIRLEHGHEASDDLVMKWWFARTFRDMADKSNHWAILDRQTVFALSSKYSILLFQHITSLTGLDRIDSKSFTVAELRAVLGVPEGKLSRFSNLMQKALKPAIDEINQLSRLILTVTPHKVGRTVARVEIGWQVKEDPTPAKKELRGHSAGRKARRSGTAEMPVLPFPSDGHIEFNAHWREIKREAGCNMDNTIIADKFRAFCRDRGIALDAHNIEQVFRGFCAKIGMIR